MGFGPLPGGLKPWNSGQTLFDGANLYYSDGTTFVDSSDNVTLLAGTIDGMVIGADTPEAGTFTSVTIPTSGNTTLTLGTPNTNYGKFTVFGTDLYIDSSRSFLFRTGVATNILAELQASGGFFLVDSSSQSTPTGGFLLYSESGQPHTLDVNAVDINISLCPQPSAIYALPLDVGDPTQVIASTASLATIQTAMNLVTAGSGDALFAVCQLMKAVQSGFNAGPAQYPVAS